MTTETTQTLVGGSLALLLTLSVGFAAGWPAWATGAAMIGLLIVTVVALRWQRDRKEQAVLKAEAEYRRQQAALAAAQSRQAPAAAPTSSNPITAVSLPSSLADVPFTFGCTVHWRSTRPVLGDAHAVPAAVAAEAILDRARQISATYRPDDGAVVHALASALGHPASDATDHLVTWATTVSAAPDQQAREHLQELAMLRRQRHIQEQRIDNERLVRSYLGDDVLRSVGSAVVWWLARDDRQVRETVDLIGTLAQLSAAANNAEPDQRFSRDTHEAGPAGPSSAVTFVADSTRDVEPEPLQTRTATDLLPDPDDSENTLFGHQYADLLDRHEHPDLAGRVRHRYGTIDSPELFEGDLHDGQGNGNRESLPGEPPLTDTPPDG